MLLAMLTPPNEPILLLHITQTASTATHIPLLPGWIAEDQSICRHIMCHDCYGSNQGKFANCYSTTKHRARTNRSSVAHQRRRNLPVVSILEFAIHGNRTRIEIVGKADTRTNKYTILQCDPFIDERIIL